jgi:3-oxoacyl-[acyl-carrier protein] reductase
MADLQGKTFLIAGALNGLAYDVGMALTDDDARVIYACPRELLEADAGPHITVLDWRDPARIGEQIAGLGPLDGVVFCPGWTGFGRFLDSTPADWDAALAHNYEGILWTAQAAARQMIMHGQGGRLIFLSSVASLMPLAGMSVMGTTLTALWGLVKMIAVDLGAYGITANLVASGWVEHEGTAEVISRSQEHITAGIPLGRVGAPSDVGAAVSFLASAEAGYITGVVIPVDGGYTLTRSAGSSALNP